MTYVRALRARFEVGRESVMRFAQALKEHQEEGSSWTCSPVMPGSATATAQTLAELDGGCHLGHVDHGLRSQLGCGGSPSRARLGSARVVRLAGTVRYGPRT